MSEDINKINPTILNKHINYKTQITIRRGRNVCLRVVEIDVDNYHLLRPAQEQCDSRGLSPSDAGAGLGVGRSGQA